MHRKEKGEYKSLLLADLEIEGDLAFLFVHTLVCQPSKNCLVDRVVGVDGYADAARDGEQAAVDADRLAQGAGDTGRAGVGDDVYRLLAGQVSGNNNELVAAKARKGVRWANNAAQVLCNVPKQFIACVVAVSVVDELEAVEVNHKEGRPGIVELGLPDGGGQSILKQTLIGKTRKVIVESMPLVGRDLLLKQNKQHADGNEKLLQVPDFVSDGIVPRVVGDPGVEEEDKRPNRETDNDSNFAQTFAGQVELKDDRRGEIKNKKDKIRRVAKRAVGSKDPDRSPRTELYEENPPTSAKPPGSSEPKGTPDAEKDTACGDSLIDARIVAAETIDGKQRDWEH